MTGSSQGYERIDLRTSPVTKVLIVRAACTAGMSASALLLSAAQERARQVLAERELLVFTARDWNAFAAALDNTDRPRPKLAAAMQRHRDWRQAQR